MNRKRKFALQRIGIILVTWVSIAIVIAVHEILFLDNFPGIFESEYLEDYSFEKSLTSGLVSSFFGAVAIGFLEEIYFRNKLKKYAIGRILVVKTLIYSVIMIFLTIVSSFLFNWSGNESGLFSDEVVNEVKQYVFSGGWLNTIIILFFAVLLTITFLQINDKMGPGQLWKFLTGKYHHPFTEERAFMFLDIKSSTMIAEKIGHNQYFSMLNDFFSDVTDPILETNGEIYQYVGDEVVITWKQKDFDKIVTCFERIKEKVDQKKKYYLNQYHEIPFFKAGIHSGQVTVGEVGVIKREVVYTGDVLNTAARIQSLCNKYNTDLLVSYSFLSHFKQYSNFEEVGEVGLRGRNEKVIIHKIVQS